MRSMALILVCFCLLSNVGQSQWVNIKGTAQSTSQCFLVSGSTLYHGSATGVDKTTDNGATWTFVGTGLTNKVANRLVTNGTNIYAATDVGIQYTSDGGSTWNLINTGMSQYRAFAVEILGSTLFAGGESSTWYSTNNGIGWTKCTATDAPYQFTRSLLVVDNTLFAGGNGGMFVTTNNGISWRTHGATLNSTNFRQMLWVKNKLFVTCDIGVYVSSDTAHSFVLKNNGLTDSYYKNVWAIAAIDSTIFIGTNWGICKSTDLGENWVAVNTGLGTGYAKSIRALAISGGYIFAGCDKTGGIWRQPLSNLLTSVEQNKQTVPQSFSLLQNYPNPFNPSTVISYQLSVVSNVKLSVFDVLGREVATLVNEVQTAGNHQITFDAHAFSSGMYFYKLTAGNFTQIKKMTLTK